MLKRFAAILLVLVMVIGVFPVSTMAENDIGSRAYLDLRGHDEDFKIDISGFKENEIEGTHIKYVYQGPYDTKEGIINSLKNENDQAWSDAFLANIESPDESIEVSQIFWRGEDRTQDFLGEENSFSGELSFLKYVDNNGKLCNASETYTIVWTNGEKETVKFSIIFPILEDDTWMDYYNSAITSDRISVFSTEEKQEITSGTSYLGFSVSSIEAGKVNASYNKAENTNEESFDIRIAVPEGATRYKLLVVTDSVDFEIDKAEKYDYQSDIADMNSLEDNLYISVPVNLGSDEGGDYTTVDGIKVYESAGNSDRKQTVIVKWLDGNGEPIPGNWSEYFYIDLTTQEEKVTTPAGSISEEVTSPASENVSITWTKKKQSIVPANSETKGKFYFELSTDDTLPEGAKIFIPYSFISSEMNKAEAEKLNINITNHSYGAEANTSDIVCEEFGMTFQTDKLGAFVLSWNEAGENEEDGRSDYLPEEFYDYWDINEFVTQGQIELEAHDALIDDLTYKFVDGVLIVTVNNVPEEDWKAAYYDLRAGALQIFADIKIEAPASNIVGVAVNNGNGPTYRNLKNRLVTNPEEIDYDEFDPQRDYVWGGNTIGQVSVDGDEVTVMPMGSGGVFFTVMLWKDNSGKVIPQILPYVFEVAEDADKVAFENEKKNVPEGNIITDDRARGENPILSAKYDETSGILEYTYNGDKSKTDAEIAEAIAGEDEKCDIETVIEAPENYYDENGQTQVTLGVSIYNRNYPLVGKSVPFDVIWYNDDGDVLKQAITIVFDPGKNWLDIIAEPITEPERIIYYSINDPDIEYRDETLESLSLAGITVDIEPGYIHSSFEHGTDIDIETVANAEAHILPPDAPKREAGESLEDWIARAYDNSEYVAIKVGSTGISDYDPQMAYDMNDFIVNMDPDDLDSGSAAVNIAEFDYIQVNGLTVWFTVNTGDKGHAIIIYWYREGSKEPDLCEYIYAKCDPLIVEETTDAVSENELNGAVEAPTPIGSGWRLTTNHFPQEKQYDDVNAYYFQLEGDENTPDEEKVIYLPYSFIDENLTYEQAVEMGLQVKIHHYNEDHTELIEGKPIDGELREEGIRFVVSSFSPFVLEWSPEEKEDVPGNVTDDKASTETVTITISGDKAQESEENPNTGAEPPLSAAAAIAFISCSAIIAGIKRH
ncbi:MAG: hypothetical protein ACI4IW_06805 [Oscillospiraceae bacterium]